MLVKQEISKKGSIMKKLAERMLSSTPVVMKEAPSEKELVEVSHHLFHELMVGSYESIDVPPSRKQAHMYLQQLKQVAIEEGEAQVPIYDALQEIKDHYIFAVWFERMIPLL